MINKIYTLDMVGKTEEWRNAVIGVIDGIWGLEFLDEFDGETVPEVVRFKAISSETWRIESILKVLELSDGGEIS